MDIHEYMENYRYGFDKTQEGRVKFEYLDYERNFINHIMDNRFSLTKKARQMHATTLLAHYVTWFLLFNEDIEINSVLYVTPKLDMGRYFTRLVKQNLTDFHSSIKPDRSTSTEIRMTNRNMLKVVSGRSDVLCGFRVGHLIVDEAAFIDEFENFLGSTLPTLADKGKASIVSTTNGLNEFYRIYEYAMTGKNDFKILSMIWSDNPKYDESWFKQMCKAMNNDQDRIDQELLAKFVSWRPRKNKTVSLQVRVSEQQIYDMSDCMNKRNSSNYSDYLRKLIEDDINSLEHE